MIKSIRLVNFQSHRETVLTFSAGVNVIIGDPQNGKTAILRGEELVRTNRPGGFRYHSNFSTDEATHVEIKVPEGKVVFTKTAQGASYTVTKGNASKTFSKMGLAVPDEVSELLNLSDLNIQNQLEPPFLIGSTPAEIAREINRITKIDLVDRWTSELNRRKHAASMLLARAQQQVEDREAKEAELAGIDAIGPLLEEAEQAANASNAAKASWNTVRLAALELGQIAAATAKLERALTAGPFLEKAMLCTEAAQSDREIIENCKEFALAQKEVDRLSRFIGMSEEVVAAYDQNSRSRQEVENLAGLIESFLNESLSMRENQIALDNWRNAYADSVVEVGICQLCFSPLGPDAREHILEHI